MNAMRVSLASSSVNCQSAVTWGDAALAASPNRLSESADQMMIMLNDDINKNVS